MKNNFSVADCMNYCDKHPKLYNQLLIHNTINHTLKMNSSKLRKSLSINYSTYLISKRILHPLLVTK